MTGAFDLWGDTRTAYNFFANERVTFAVVLESPMTVVSRALRERFEGTTVLNVQDTTEINLSHLNSMTGLGEIGNPKNRGLFLHPSLAYAVQVTEIDPPAGVEPIEWLLLTSDPITSIEAAWQRVEWYRCRWRIEEFFQVLKSGCHIEARQFESRSTYEPSLAIALLTAVRLLSMVKQARVTPDVPASAVLSQDEEHVLVQHAQAKKMGHCNSSPLRLVDAVVLIAMLGGYKARSCDGPPGWITLWRGLRRLEDMVEGYRLAHPELGCSPSHGSLLQEETS
jgi:hypothetical protein